MGHRAVSHFFASSINLRVKKKNTTGRVKHFDVCTCLRWCLRVRIDELHGHRKVRHVLGILTPPRETQCYIRRNEFESHRWTHRTSGHPSACGDETGMRASAQCKKTLKNMRAVCRTWACVWATLSIRLSRFDGRLAGMTWDRRASCELGGKGLKLPRTDLSLDSCWCNGNDLHEIRLLRKCE